LYPVESEFEPVIELDAITKFLADKDWQIHYRGWESISDGSCYADFTHTDIQNDLDTFNMFVCPDGRVAIETYVFSRDAFGGESPNEHHLHLGSPDFFEKLMEILNHALGL
jgi:hypothetical protein